MVNEPDIVQEDASCTPGIGPATLKRKPSSSLVSSHSSPRNGTTGHIGRVEISKFEKNAIF